MSYQLLTEHFARMARFEELGAIVSWDQAVNMPPAAGASRARSLAALSRLTHEMVSQPELSQWLENAETESLDDWQAANVREMQRAYQRAVAVPADLIERSTQTCHESEQAWRRYKKENDFDSFAPYLEQVVSLQREVAAVLGDALHLEPYDALLDGFEAGLTSSQVDTVFQPLREFLPNFLQEVLEQQGKNPAVIPKGPFPVERQKALAARMMGAAGLDLERARLDESAHPFCGGVPDDVRITNRYRPEELLSGLMGVLHESGHGKYEQGLPRSYIEQPVGRARGMAVHESQSLLQEMQVSRGAAFCEFLASQIAEFFPEQVQGQPEAYTPENLARLQTRVERGFIRVDADEVTYPAHVILRYELERELIGGRLRVRDLPEAWDQKMRAGLGLSTGNDHARGCMQDVHWPAGAFGYFPLYTLGAVLAAQLFRKAGEDLPDLEDDLRRGTLNPLNTWLGTHVWSQGRRWDATALATRVTGRGFDPLTFIEHLQNRYLSG